MSHRWLAGILVFALGFGSAFLMRIGRADAAPTDGEVEPGLAYSDSATSFKLVNSGTKNYLVIVTRKQSMIPTSDPLVTYAAGSSTFSKDYLQSLRIYRVTPVGELQVTGGFRPCNGGPDDCPLPQPLPPPPPPYLTFVEKAP